MLSAQMSRDFSVDMIFDPIVGPDLEVLTNVAAKGGVIFLYGALSPKPTPFPLTTAMKKGLLLRGYTLWEILRWRSG